MSAAFTAETRSSSPPASRSSRNAMLLPTVASKHLRTWKACRRSGRSVATWPSTSRAMRSAADRISCVGALEATYVQNSKARSSLQTAIAGGCHRKCIVDRHEFGGAATDPGHARPFRRGERRLVDDVGQRSSRSGDRLQNWQRSVLMRVNHVGVLPIAPRAAGGLIHLKVEDQRSM
ncbi:hypothetical protein SAMN02927900_05257 [Rhizobium mongolense subsp. loessense]|uniref:Uncharacterized protein n=1 Tax=Rhizobium mongolense subsp. loessense TaxID=158890 RepID=A0A1G4TLX8_9HYPH|nr:hypothetical protein SAMN02927900_05257 [Rhizobium mongolense subsp. loessense]